MQWNRSDLSSKDGGLCCLKSKAKESSQGCSIILSSISYASQPILKKRRHINIRQPLLDPACFVS